MPRYGAEERRARVPGVGGDYTPLIVGEIGRATDRTRGTIADMYASAGANARDRWGILGEMTGAPLSGLRGLSEAAVWRQNRRRQALAEEAQKKHNASAQLDLEEKQDEHQFMNEPMANDHAPAPSGQLPPWQPPGAPGGAPPVDSAPWRASSPTSQAPSLGLSPTGQPVTRRRGLLGAQYGNMMAEEGMGNWRRGQEQTVATERTRHADVAARAGEAGIRLTNAQIGQVGAGAGMTARDRAEAQGKADLEAFYQDPVKNAGSIEATKAGLRKAGIADHHIQGIEGQAMLAVQRSKANAGQTNFLLTPSGMEANAKISNLKERLGHIRNAHSSLTNYKAKVGYGEIAPTSLHPEAASALGQFKESMAGMRPDVKSIGDTNFGTYGIVTTSEKGESVLREEIAKIENEILQLKASPDYRNSTQMQDQVNGLEQYSGAVKQLLPAVDSAAGGAAHNSLNLLTPQAGAGGGGNAGMFQKRPTGGTQTWSPTMGGEPGADIPPARAMPPPPKPVVPTMNSSPTQGTMPGASLGQPSFRHLAMRKPIDAREMQTI